jgi:hypothetical protein
MIDRIEGDDVDHPVSQYHQIKFQHNPEYREIQIRSLANQLVSNAMEDRRSIHKVMCNQKTRYRRQSQVELEEQVNGEKNSPQMPPLQFD